MRIIRYEDRYGRIHHGIEQSSGSSFLRAEGELFGTLKPTQEATDIARILAPVDPAMIWCIGQNYRQHAKEVGIGVGEYPVVFAKGVNAVQDPDGPIVLPETARSTEVDSRHYRRNRKPLQSGPRLLRMRVFSTFRYAPAMD